MSKTKIGIILLTVLVSSCTKLFDDKIRYSEMKVNIKNNSDLTIKKAGFYAHNSVSNMKTFADSVIVENIIVGDSKQFVIDLFPK